jgi:hypothetical protein
MQREDIKAYAKEVADKLGEEDDYPIRQIELLIEHAGKEFVAEKLEETEKIESEGGMKTEKGNRRRTKGGVFFYLAKGDLKWKLRNMIFPNFGQKNKGRTMEWHERQNYIEPLLEDDARGTAHEIQIRVTGRPGEIAYVHNNSVVLTLHHDYRLTTLPRGVPQPMYRTETVYTVYVDKKAWEKISEKLEEDDDALLTVEGPGLYDTETESIAVLGKHVALAGEETDDTDEDDTDDTDDGESETADAKADAKETDKKAKKQAPPAPAPEPDKEETDDEKAARYGIPDDVSDEVREELIQLYSGAEALRERIATMEKQNKPGVKMTKRLLKNTEKKIERLMKPYS